MHRGTSGWERGPSSLLFRASALPLVNFRALASQRNRALTSGNYARQARVFLCQRAGRQGGVENDDAPYDVLSLDIRMSGPSEARRHGGGGSLVAAATSRVTAYDEHALPPSRPALNCNRHPQEWRRRVWSNTSATLSGMAYCTRAGSLA